MWEESDVVFEQLPNGVGEFGREPQNWAKKVGKLVPLVILM